MGGTLLFPRRYAILSWEVRYWCLGGTLSLLGCTPFVSGKYATFS